MKNILKEIETKYPVDTILVNGEQVWPYLRIAYHFRHIENAVSEYGEKQLRPETSLFQRPKTAFKMLGYSFYGLGNWFGKYTYIALSNTGERRDVNGKYLNKLLDPFIDELGRDRVLYVETPAHVMYPVRKGYTKRVVFRHLPELSAVILTKLLRKKCIIQNKWVLDSIQKEYDLEINDVSRVKYFKAQKIVFNLIFRKIKPKAILLSCYYGHNQAAIKAARDIGIAVIEFQHGTISKEDPAYNVNIELDKTFFPDYLLVFGRRELETFDNSRFIEPQNVRPIGSFYLEYIKKNYQLERNLVELLKEYKASVGVTLEWTMQKRVIEFIRKAANLDRAILYLLIPRWPKERYYLALGLPDNVMIVTDKNFYELMMYVDFHSTVYSTCALEAPSLGVQNILINIDGLSNRYYGKVLTDSGVTRYVETPEEFVKTVNTFERLSRDTISKFNEDIFAINYTNNIQRLLQNPPFCE